MARVVNSLVQEKERELAVERDGADRRDERSGRETAGRLVSRRERKSIGENDPNADLCFQRKKRKKKNYKNYKKFQRFRHWHFYKFR